MNTPILTYQRSKYLEHNRLSVNEGVPTGFGIGSKSPIGDVGSLLWHHQSATLAAKELIVYCMQYIFISFLLSKFCDIKVACTSGPIFEKIMKRYPIFFVQIIYCQIDQMHI